jgi:hypothetical protein
MSVLKNFDARTEQQYHSLGFFPLTGRGPVWSWILSSKPYSHFNGLRRRLGANTTISCCSVTVHLVIASVQQSRNMQAQSEIARA